MGVGVWSTVRSAGHTPPARGPCHGGRLALRITARGKLGTAKFWNGKIWHNKSVPNYAAAFEGALFYVSCSALLACTFPLPSTLQQITATNHKPIGNSNHHSQSMPVLAPQSGNFVPKFEVVFRNWC